MKSPQCCERPWGFGERHHDHTPAAVLAGEVYSRDLSVTCTFPMLIAWRRHGFEDTYRCSRPARTVAGSGLPVLYAGEGVEVALVGVGEGVEVLLGGLDLGVPHAFHHGLQVAAAGEEPGGVGVAEVVDPDSEVDAGGFDCGQPDPGAEGVARDGGASLRREEQVVVPDPVDLDVLGDGVSQAWRTPKVRGSLSLG